MKAGVLGPLQPMTEMGTIHRTQNTQNKVYRAGAKVMKLSSGTSVYLASVRGSVGANTGYILPMNWNILRLGFVFGQFKVELEDALGKPDGGAEENTRVLRFGGK